jgi:opacity protein-like surface antigen
MIVWRSSRKRRGGVARLNRSIHIFLSEVFLHKRKQMMVEVLQQRGSGRTRIGCGHVFACAAVLVSAVALFTPTVAAGQSMPTASRVGDLQIGGGFVFANSRYNFAPITLIGGAGYVTFDWRDHWGVEGGFRNARANQDTTVYERTYEVGPRIFLTRGAFSPYAKVLIGRGVYNFHDNVANVAYNMYTYGGGVDFRATRSLNVRADYELQNWINFPLGTLHPSVITIGVAYHFNSRGAPDYPR